MLGCYLIIQLAIFTGMFLFDMILLLNSSMVENWARKEYDNLPADQKDETIEKYIDLMKKYIDKVTYALIIFTLVVGFTIFFGWCYRNSTLDRTFDRREKAAAKKAI